MKVLVVDDSRAMRMIVSRELRLQVGVSEVIEAEHAAAAAETLATTEVDLVLCDWNMPDVNGLELLQHLRSHEWQGLFGFITSEAGHETRRQALEAGAAFLITKPFTGEELARCISLAQEGAVASAEQVEVQGTEEQVASMLERLLRRPVEVRSIMEAPRKEVARVVASYADPAGGEAGMCVTEITVAAAAGAALSMVPASAAMEWVQAGALPDTIAQNFHEVANVLSNVVHPGLGRCVLQSVSIFADFEKLPRQEEAESAPHRRSLEVHVDGYDPGRMALIGF